MAAPFRTADEAWAELMEGNRRFVENRPQARDLAAERAAVALEQHPKAVVLACADSRVAPEIAFDQKLGDLFTIRAAGNSADALVLGSIEYAAERLGVPLLVVLGHKRCGAIEAAASGEKFESANLKTVVRRVRPACEQASGFGEDRLRAAERANVALAAREVVDRSPLLHALVHQGKFGIAEAYYDLDTGAVERLDVGVARRVA